MSSLKKNLIFHPEATDVGQRKRRGRIRFKPDHNTIAYAKPIGQKAAEYDSFVGLVIDESHSGCKIAFLEQVAFASGDRLFLSVGKLPTVIAEVKWRKKAGSSLVEIGFEYCEG